MYVCVCVSRDLLSKINERKRAQTTITMWSLWPPLKLTDNFSFTVNVIVQTARRDEEIARGCAGIKREISILRDMKESFSSMKMGKCTLDVPAKLKLELEQRLTY